MRLNLCVFVCMLLLSHPLFASEFTSVDINTSIPGSTLELGAGSYEISGGGTDIWNSEDGFRYVYQTISGDFDICSRVAAITETDPWSKAGLMVRASLESTSVHAMMIASAQNGFAFQYRPTSPGGSFHTSGGGIQFPYSWVRLIRVGSVVAGYRSNDVQGDEWQFVGSVNLDLPSSVLVGLCVTAHDNNALCTAQFDCVNIQPFVAPALGSGSGLNGRYFNNRSFSGAPALTRTDASIDFNWQQESPDPTINTNNFAVHWSGYIEPQYSELYTFFTSTDDGVRLWIDGKLVINNWTDHGVTEDRSQQIFLEVGHRYPIVLEYFENGGYAEAKLSWRSRSTSKAIVPTTQLYNDTIPAIQAFGNGLKGEYFASENLTTSSLIRLDSTINFNWGVNSPSLVIPTDGYSVRWTGTLSSEFTGLHTFYTESDDGVRLWVNGMLLIDNWTPHSLTENSGTIALTAGIPNTIRLEYFERTGDSAIALKWSSARESKDFIAPAQLNFGTGTGFYAEYFNNSDFTSPALHRIDATINFNWGTQSPDALVSPDTFSARWSGSVDPSFSEYYIFHVVSDDGIRLWVNGSLVIDNWTLHSETENSTAPILLSAGVPTNIKLEYFENTGDAVAKLYWSSASQPKQLIPAEQIYPVGGFIASIPNTSQVSPACLEGSTWSVNGQYGTVNFDTTGETTSLTHLGTSKFFVNVPLNENGSVEVNLEHSLSGVLQHGMITWSPTDIRARSFSNDQITLRTNDSLLLTATGSGQSLSIDADGNGVGDFTGVPGDKYKKQYTQTGTYIVSAKIDGKLVGTLLINVVDVDLHAPIACQVGFTRIKDVKVIPFSSVNLVKFTSTNESILAVNETGTINFEGTDYRTLSLTSGARGNEYLIARIGANGPIIGYKEIDEFTIDTPAIAQALISARDNVGGTIMTIRPWVPNVLFKFDMFAHTSTFDGGAVHMEVNTSDPAFKLYVDANTGETIGKLKIGLEVPALESMYCFRFVGTQAASRQAEVTFYPNVNGMTCKVEYGGGLYIVPECNDEIPPDLVGDFQLEKWEPQARLWAYNNLENVTQTQWHLSILDGICDNGNGRPCEVPNICEELELRFPPKQSGQCSTRWPVNGCQPCDKTCNDQVPVHTGIKPASYDAQIFQCGEPEPIHVIDDFFVVMRVDADGLTGESDRDSINRIPYILAGHADCEVSPSLNVVEGKPFQVSAKGPYGHSVKVRVTNKSPEFMDIAESGGRYQYAPGTTGSTTPIEFTLSPGADCFDSKTLYIFGLKANSVIHQSEILVEAEEIRYVCEQSGNGNKLVEQRSWVKADLEKVTIFDLDADLTLTPGGPYGIAGGRLTSVGAESMTVDSTVFLIPAGLDTSKTEIQRMYAALIQNVETATLSNVYALDSFTFAAGAPAGTTINVPNQYYSDGRTLPGPAVDSPEPGHGYPYNDGPKGPVDPTEELNYEDTPSKPVAASKDIPFVDGAGNPVGTAHYVLKSAQYNATFTVWVLGYDLLDRTDFAIKQAEWEMHIDSEMADQRPTATSAHAPDKCPIKSGLTGNESINSVPAQSGFVDSQDTRTFTK